MPTSVCEKCGGSGWRVVERDGMSGAEPCGCTPLEPPQDFEAAARVPPLFQNASLSNFSTRAAHPNDEQALQLIQLTLSRFLRDFPGGPKPGLLFIGPTGTGKTHLAVAVLKRLMAKGFPGLFYDYADLLASIRGSWSDVANAADREAYASTLEAPVLLLDDLGSQRVTDWVEDTVTGIITHRYNNRKPTLVTTNLPDPDAGFVAPYRAAVTLVEKIGIRARSRLFEMCEVIRMPEVPDYRLRKGR